MREADPIDVADLPADVRDAVLGVIAAGLFDVSASGLFEPDRALAASDLKEVTVRLERLLGLLAD